jgi:hypothetical protein
VEYATREDAQTAIDTMSNTQLMGRLVYVREVSTHIYLSMERQLTVASRIVRPSHALLEPLAEVVPAADLAAVVVSKAVPVASRAAWAVATAVAPPVVDVPKSTSPT